MGVGAGVADGFIEGATEGFMEGAIEGFTEGAPAAGALAAGAAEGGAEDVSFIHPEPRHFKQFVVPLQKIHCVLLTFTLPWHQGQTPVPSHKPHFTRPGALGDFTGALVTPALAGLTGTLQAETMRQHIRASNTIIAFFIRNFPQSNHKTAGAASIILTLRCGHTPEGRRSHDAASTYVGPASCLAPKNNRQFT